jgi:pimeloyl-ACP methyl ester carboxylesterase
MATYVLVHGGWHGGWCWKKIVPLLRAHGHEVFTPTLTGLGERSHLAHPLVDLETHVTDVVNVLVYEDLSDVILLGHSNGGTLITAVAERVPERLAHLIYLDAFVPEDGQATIDLVEAPPGAFEARARTDGFGWLLPSLRPMPWNEFIRDVWGVTDEADQRWMLERLGPTPFKVFTDPVRRTNPAAEALPRTYIRCLYNAPMAAFDRFAEAAKTTPGWHYRELATPHEPFITHPEELANLLLDFGP